jgi:hypothetical protein
MLALTCKEMDMRRYILAVLVVLMCGIIPAFAEENTGKISGDPDIGRVDLPRGNCVLGSCNGESVDDVIDVSEEQ